MNWRRVLIPFFLLVVFLFLNYYIGSQLPNGGGAEIPLTTLVGEIKRGDVTQLKIGTDKVEVLTADGQTSTVNLGTMGVGDVVPTLRALGVTEDELAVVEITYLTPPTNWRGIISFFLPLLLFGGFFLFFMRSRGRDGGILDFGKSRARMLSGAQSTVTFDDIAGC